MKRPLQRPVVQAVPTIKRTCILKNNYVNVCIQIHVDTEKSDRWINQYFGKSLQVTSSWQRMNQHNPLCKVTTKYCPRREEAGQLGKESEWEGQSQSPQSKLLNSDLCKHSTPSSRCNPWESLAPLEWGTFTNQEICPFVISHSRTSLLNFQLFHHQQRVLTCPKPMSSPNLSFPNQGWIIGSLYPVNLEGHIRVTNNSRVVTSVAIISTHKQKRCIIWTIFSEQTDHKKLHPTLRSNKNWPCTRGVGLASSETQSQQLNITNHEGRHNTRVPPLTRT